MSPLDSNAPPTTDGDPFTVGAVDMGSKNFKFVLGRKMGGAITTELIGKERLEIGREVTENHGLIGVGKMAQIEQALARFVRHCHDRGVSKVLAIATSAIRNARNHQQIIDLARETGITLDLADGVREGEVGYFAATSGAPGNLVSDSGSKSIQIAWERGGRIHSRSVPVGYQLAYETFVDPEPAFGETERNFRRFLDGNFPGLPGDTDRYYALAANTIASFVTGDARRSPLRTVGRIALDAKLSELRSLSTSRYGELKSTLPGAEKILPGVVFLDYVLEHSGHEEAIVSENELPVGLIVEYFLTRG